MSIQQSINQAASIGAALYTQIEAAAEKKEKKALTREAESIRKGARAKENISQRLRHGLKDAEKRYKSIKQYKQDVKESVNSYRSLLGLPPKEVK